MTVFHTYGKTSPIAAPPGSHGQNSEAWQRTPSVIPIYIFFLFFWFSRDFFSPYILFMRAKPGGGTWPAPPGGPLPVLSPGLFIAHPSWRDVQERALPEVSFLYVDE